MTSPVVGSVLLWMYEMALHGKCVMNALVVRGFLIIMSA